ncbi:Rv3235 family protein [Agreia sp.]|uniref:Rv3235 family protein n=1 Tax=Agreia sp. TaxID=1872416 RepID=UPI0035BBF7D3
MQSPLTAHATAEQSVVRVSSVLRAVPPLAPDEAGSASAEHENTEYFGAQPASTSSLPNPVPLMENLARCVLEVLAGARDLDQLSRWVADDVYRHLLKRVVLSTRARQARGAPIGRPSFRIGNTITCEPADGVVEGVVIVHGKARTRAVAIRLEGLDKRWRASAINVL